MNGEQEKSQKKIKDFLWRLTALFGAVHATGIVGQIYLMGTKDGLPPFPTELAPVVQQVKTNIDILVTYAGFSRFSSEQIEAIILLLQALNLTIVLYLTKFSKLNQRDETQE